MLLIRLLLYVRSPSSRRDITFLSRVPRACRVVIGDPITVKRLTIASYERELQSLERKVQREARNIQSKDFPPMEK